ncbi:MAG: hypothetical protein RLZZ347_353 [Candidatus Parcubacteria bacterium]|jgi:LPXTG-site transpeptidase (sortase) family protein
MHSRTLAKQVCTIITLVGIAFAVCAFTYPDTLGQIRIRLSRWSESGTRTTELALQPGLPTLLILPRLNIRASVESIGLTKDGALDTPKEPDIVAWFNAGPRPGEKGNAIIDGHYGWKDGIPAVFDSLSQTQIGDSISIQDDHGNVITFVVHKIQIYTKEDTTSDIFNAQDKDAHLVLITCQGAWNKASQSYAGRLIVFADKVETL